MPRESLVQVTKRRLLGVLFIVVVIGLVSLSIAIYNKAFTSTVVVTLRAQHTGNQLQLDSDVKERGIIVGSVTGVASDGKDAVVTLALEPSRVADIPKNVTARILPKTLFGEQYVSLQLPKGTKPGSISDPIQAGDVIPQDRTKGALEAQTVLGDLLPLLTAVQPAELNDTLNALATALKGRGEELGRTLVNFDKYLKIINPHTQALVDDLHKLGQVSLEYNDVAPDIFSSLKNLQTSAHTVIEKRGQLDQLLTVGSSASDVLASFLDTNRQRLIDITGQTNKVFALLKEYSPSLPCVFAGVSKLDTLADGAISDHSIHLSLTADLSNLGPYKPGNQPKLITGYGPQCFGLPDPSKPFQIPGKYRCINDGAPLTADPCAQRPGSPGPETGGTSSSGSGGKPASGSSGSGSSGSGSSGSGSSGSGSSGAKPGTSGAQAHTTAASIGTGASDDALNSAGENALVDTLISGQLGTTPDKVPGIDTLLAAPLLRGSQVVIR